jgi:hypothetical protein
MKLAGALLMALVVGASGCGLHGLSLVQDTRIHITGPRDRSKVELPITVRWHADGFAAGPGQGSYGVLVDRTPPPAGRTLAWLFRGQCVGCVDAGYLAQRRVYETTGSSITIGDVAPKASTQDGGFHEVTIVLLDARGARVGEGAWTRQFKVLGHR